MEKRPVIFFDVETNGLSGSSSVLSIAAIKAMFDETAAAGEETFSRFYYRNPGEREDPQALAVNGLTDAVIRAKRAGVRYAKHFHNDKDFEQFCAGVNHYVGHNISFDRKFLPFSLKHCFCTMKENTAVIKLKKMARSGYKYPRLSEAAAYYGLAADTGRLHGSDYDTRLTCEIFKKMLYSPKTRRRVLEFLNSR
jgi:DNA polymerase III epsilon subunit-like protein